MYLMVRFCFFFLPTTMLQRCALFSERLRCGENKRLLYTHSPITISALPCQTLLDALLQSSRFFFCSMKRDFFFFTILTKQHCTVVADLLAFIMQISHFHYRVPNGPHWMEIWWLQGPSEYSQVVFKITVWDHLSFATGCVALLPETEHLKMLHTVATDRWT